MKTNLKIIAQLALLFLALRGTAPAQDPPHGSTTLIILADRHIQQHLWPVLVPTLQRDAQAESAAAPVTGNLHIVFSGKNMPGPAFPSRIEVELLGRCDDLWDENTTAQFGPLGWVLENSGKIAPVIYVDCGRLSQVIWPKTRAMTESQRQRAVSQAISHVILHEWIHIATQSPEHAEYGVMRPSLSANDLVTPIETSAKLALRTSEPSSN
ncbi:MAG TPA: hypothetical protein VHZ09_20315 [Acidobacteriaceae bacterium]|jgi:hypothetical protein|nr:hypothetical protein [Acidobacteriaceae bacterium]